MKVEMGEVKVCARGTSEEVLVACRVSTDIVIMLYGSYDEKPFILMDRWDSEVIGDRNRFIRNKVWSYIPKIQDAVIDNYDPDIHDDISVYIEKTIVIGGEKKQFDNNGLLLVSGTESSVELLKSTLLTEIGNSFELTQNATQSWNNYLTSENQSIEVQIDIKGETSYVLQENLSDFTEDNHNQRLQMRLL